MYSSNIGFLNFVFFQSGKACLGEILYRYLTADHFSPERLLDHLDLSSEYSTLETANTIEAAVHIWKRKCLKRSSKQVKPVRSSWGGKVKGLVAGTEKSKLLVKRAETLLQNLKLRFPGLPQTNLDMNKIQYNKVRLSFIFNELTQLCLSSASSFACLLSKG